MMGIRTDCCEYGEMIDSAAIMQGIRRMKDAGLRLKTPPRPCPARRPDGNSLATILKGRLVRSLRRWRR